LRLRLLLLACCPRGLAPLLPLPGATGSGAELGAGRRRILDLALRLVGPLGDDAARRSAAQRVGGARSGRPRR
jgi:hypothetical protein